MTLLFVAPTPLLHTTTTSSLFCDLRSSSSFLHASSPRLSSSLPHTSITTTTTTTTTTTATATSPIKPTTTTKSAPVYPPLTPFVWRDGDPIPALDMHNGADPSAYFVNHHEIPQPIRLRITTGTLPSYLHNEHFFRLGLGLRTASHRDGGKWEAPHPFEYLSMVTRLSFTCSSSNPQKQYISLIQKLNCHHVLDSIAQHSAVDYVSVKLAATNRTSMWDMLRTWKPPTFNTRTFMPNYNYGVVCERIPGWGLVARTDGASAQQLNADTLQQGKEFTFGDLSPLLRGTLMAPSHGVYDAEAGEYVNVAWDFPPLGGDAKYRVFRVDGMGQTEVLGMFKKQPTFMHCVAVTKKYVIVLLPPVRVSVPMFLMSLSLGDSLRDAEGEDDDDDEMGNGGTGSDMRKRGRRKIGGTAVVVCRKGTRGVVAQIELDADTPLTAMHVANAWDVENSNNGNEESSDSIMIETIASNMSLGDMVNIDASAMAQLVPSDSSPGRLVRLTLNNIPSSSSSTSTTTTTVIPPRTNNNKQMKKTAIKWNIVNSFSGELPTINPTFKFKQHRFTYSVVQVNGLVNSCVRKTDAESSDTGLSFAMSGCVFDEPLFVPDPNGMEEDDGVLLLVGLDTVRKVSIVCVLDAKELKVKAMAEIEEEKYRVPMAFHWYRDVRH